MDVEAIKKRLNPDDVPEIANLLSKAGISVWLGDPETERRHLQALCDELDRMGYRPTGWVEPSVLR